VRGLAQIAVAAGQAAIAATHIYNQLRARENKNAHQVVGVRESERELS
jgi:hypothetical protein